MAGAETARTIAFSVRKMALQPWNLGGVPALGAGIPIVLDTLTESNFAFTTDFDEIRGGPYQYPLAADPKAMKGELTAKVLDCPPSLIQLLLAGTIVSSTTPGPAFDNIENTVGNYIATKLTITTPGAAVSGIYAIVATGLQTYVVYDLSTGKAAATFTTLIGAGTSDTVSVAGVTLSWVANSANFTVGDCATFEIVNIGGSGSGETKMDTITGPISFPVTLPYCKIVADATRRNISYQLHLYFTVLEGVAYPMGQGKYVIPDFKARLIQPPFNAPAGIVNPWRYRRIA